MGKDHMYVVNSKLQVIRIEGLRVADASIIPDITSGITKAVSIMIREKTETVNANSKSLKFSV